MDKLSIIQQPILDELNLLNRTLAETLSTSSPLMNTVVDYFLGTKGKQIRPMLVLLSARLFGKINAVTIDAAAAIELLHNASLIHDDVVDESKRRRGKPTVNGVWDNRIAVLVGDYFVSCALKRSISTGILEVIDTLGLLGQELAKGEIDQLSIAQEHILNEEAYFNVIRQKTASLFVSCMKMGALSNGASSEEIERLMLFGEKLGLCFQIKDDTFDYFSDDTIGKPTGNDLREGKVTLPLIFAIQNGTVEEKDEMLGILRQGELSPQDIIRLTDFAKLHGGIEYAENVMERLRYEGYETLAPFGENPVVESLKAILDYTIDRIK
ncbi:polyprenyl synthetase family protein [Coprobacter sp.]